MTTDYRHDLQLYDSYVDPQNKPMAYRQENHRLMQVWKRQSLSRVQLFAIPWIVAHHTPLSAGFPRQEYWSELPFPSPGDLPDPGIKPRSPALAGRFFTTEPPGKPTKYEKMGFSSLFQIFFHSITEMKPCYMTSRVLGTGLQRWLWHSWPLKQHRFELQESTYTWFFTIGKYYRPTWATVGWTYRFGTTDRDES